MGEGNVSEGMEIMIGKTKSVLEGTDRKEVSDTGGKTGWNKEYKEKKRKVR